MALLEASTQRYTRMKDDYTRDPHLTYPSKFLKYNRAITHLSKLQILLSFVFICLAALGDFMAMDEGSLRVYGLLEVIGFYLLITGFIGMAAALSYRRGLLITAAVMHVHTVIIAVPVVTVMCCVIVAAHYNNCNYICATDNVGYTCEMKCGNYNSETLIHYTSVTGDIRIEFGLLVLTGIQLLLSVGLCFASFACVSEEFGIVNDKLLQQITRNTTLRRSQLDLPRTANISIIEDDTRADNFRRNQETAGLII